MNDVLSTKERRAFGSMKLAYANFFPRRFQMKFLLLPALIVVGCQAAVAQTSQCSTVPKASDRLACYDKVTPPTAGKKPAASRASAPPDRAAAVSDSPNQAPLADLLAAENSRLDAKIKNICRGC